MSTSENTSLQTVFLAREPVLDKHQLLAGYELFFSDPTTGTSGESSADLVSKAFAELSLGQALSGCRAFVCLDAATLDDAHVAQLPSNLVVLQLKAASLADPIVLARVQELKAAGHVFCFAEFTPGVSFGLPVLELASYLKFSLKDVPTDALQALTSDLRAARRPLVAKGVDTQAQMELCALLGVELFQGYYFTQPDLQEGRVLDPSIQAIFRLIGQLAADAEIEDLEAVLRTEPALVVNLLHLTNSVGVGARSRIVSIRQAITVLGRRQLMRWLQLLLFRTKDRGEVGDNPLMQYAALRGRFMEILATRLHPGNSRLLDPAFITGLLSVLPAALGISMREILAQLPVDDAVQLALLHKEGELGGLLGLLDAYDANDSADVITRLQGFPGSQTGLLAEVLVESLSWVQTLKTAG